MKGIRYCKYMVWMLAIMVMLYVLPLGGILKPNALSEQRVLTVGFDAEFPPYGYKDEDGNYIGFDLDLAQAVCDRNDWLLQKQPIDWNSKDMELDSGNCKERFRHRRIAGLEREDCGSAGGFFGIGSLYWRGRKRGEQSTV